MKVAITADLHLKTKDDCPERYNVLENIIQVLEADNIDNLLIAGDLFDKDFHNYTEFEKLCKSHPKTRFHIIPGNHDANISGKSIVADNINIYDETTIVDIGSTNILFVPYEEQVSMGEKIAGKEEEIKDKEWVLIGHGDYYGGEKEPNPLEPGTYMPLSRETVLTFRPRAVFLGHIHKPVNWQNVYYAGSPCGLDISEVGKRRFLVYDTESRSVMPIFVTTDTIFFEETFILVPFDNEVPFLKKEIEERITSWGIAPEDYSKIVVRVSAIGYSKDRGVVLSTLKEALDQFQYYKNEGPNIDNLFISVDHQLNAIAERTLKLIDELDCNFSEGEPDRNMVKMQALNVIYGC